MIRVKLLTCVFLGIVIWHHNGESRTEETSSVAKISAILDQPNLPTGLQTVERMLRDCGISQLRALMINASSSTKLAAAWEFSKRKFPESEINASSSDWFAGYFSGITNTLPPREWLLAVDRSLLMAWGDRDVALSRLNQHVKEEWLETLKKDPKMHMVEHFGKKIYLPVHIKTKEVDRQLLLMREDGRIIARDIRQLTNTLTSQTITLLEESVNEGTLICAAGQILIEPFAIGFIPSNREGEIAWHETVRAGSPLIAGVLMTPPEEHYLGVCIVRADPIVHVYGWTSFFAFAEGFDAKLGKSVYRVVTHRPGPWDKHRKW